MKHILGFIAVALCLLMAGEGALAQATNDYRTRQSGNWNDGATWERYNGTAWIPQATFPSVAATATSSKNSTGGTTHTVSLPAGIQSGDLLLIFWSDANDVNTAPSTPSGWTQLYTSTNGNSIRRTWYKIADGTEGTTLNITAGAERSAHNSYRIAAGTYQGVPVAGTVATGNNTTPDPPSLTSGFGATNTLWIASLHMHNDDGGGITNPTSYGSQETANTGSSGSAHARMVTARRELNAASENPGTFGSVSTTVQWAANTIAIQSVATTGTPTSASGAITIRSPHTVTVTANVTVDQVTVEAGGEVALPGSTFTIANGSGDDFVVDGTLSRTGGTLTQNAGSTLVFNNGGTYIHGLNGNTVPTATWNANSNCNITGMTSTYPVGMGQTFGNVAFNINTSSDIVMSSSLTCQGNLSIANANASGTVRLTDDGTSRTITVGGNFTHTTGEFRQSNGTGTGNITVAGNFIKSGAGEYVMASDAASVSLTVGGNVSITAGTVTMSEAAGNGTLNVAGNFTHTSGTITETSGGVGNVVFNGGGTPQVYTSGGTVSNTINFTVNSGAFLQMAAAGTVVSGGGTFTLSSGGTLGIRSTAGIATGGAGNIQTSIRTFNPGANYVYNGTASQATGNLLPGTVNSLTVDNVAGVGTMTNPVTVSSLLGLTSGNLNNSTNNVTLANGATIERATGTLSVAPAFGTTVNVKYTGTTQVTTGNEMPPVTLSPAAVSVLENLEIDNSGGVILSEPVLVNGTLTLTQGELEAISPNTITIDASNTAPGAVAIPNLLGTIRGTITRTIDATQATQEYKFTSFNTFIAPDAGQSGTREVTLTVHPDELPSPIGNPGAAIRRWYQIDLTGGAFMAEWLSLAYDNAENVNLIGEADVAIFRLRPTTTSWENYGPFFGEPEYAQAQFVGDWSTKFALSDGNVALPVQLASFTGAVVNNGNVRLDWRTITEINNYGFYVQKRAMGTTAWNEIAGSFVPGHGTTNEPRQYTYTDVSGIAGPTQYRLKQVDLDGTQHFTEPILVDSPTSVPEVAPKVFALSQNYPNPFNPSTEIKFTVEVTGRATLDVYNSLGQKVATLFDGIAEAGQFNRIQFNASGIASGVYFYRLVSGQKSDLKKLMLLK